jgi:tetratricopeptide (TPR) repeat protein
VPEALAQAPGAEEIDIGWRYLQNNDPRSAEREFTRAIRRSPTLYPAQTGVAYSHLARKNYSDALTHFNAALAGASAYVPALVGKGQALLGLNQDREALQVFEAAMAADPTLTDVRRRVDVLRLRSAQALVENARARAKEGKLDDARAAYRRALEGAPDSAFLHRELGVVERKRGDSQAALDELRKAVELDSSDAASFIQIGEILEERLDFPGAQAAYESAAAIEPSDVVTKRLAGVAEKARLAKLPPEFHAIPASTQITRGDLAALIGIRLEPMLQRAPQRQVVITDARDHWAAPWITQVAGAGVLDPFSNHTFQPGSRVRRGDLADAVSRLVLLATADDPARRDALTAARPKIADMAPGHLSYPAVSVAVASGVMPLVNGDRFAVTQAVTGAEAIDVINRVAALARDIR